MEESSNDKRPKGVVRLIGIALLVIGLAGFFFSFVCSYGHCKWMPGSVALPLSTVDSLAVDNDGRIYCALTAHGRIQQYSSDGRFLRGWWIDTSGGVFRLRIEKGHLLVQTARTKLLYVFDLNGRQLAKARNNISSMGDFAEGPEKDKTGNRYTVANPVLLPRLVKTTPSGQNTVLVSVPLYL